MNNIDDKLVVKVAGACTMYALYNQQYCTIRTNPDGGVSFSMFANAGDAPTSSCEVREGRLIVSENNDFQRSLASYLRDNYGELFD